MRAETPEQRQANSALKKLKQNAPKSIAFLIALGKVYRQRGVFEVDNLEEKLATLLPKLGGRTLNGYAHLIWFTEQASFRVPVFSARKMVMYVNRLQILWEKHKRRSGKFLNHFPNKLKPYSTRTKL